MFESLGAMNHASNALGLIAKRQKILGENLANVDTPGYTRKELDFTQHMGLTAGSSLETRLATKLGDSPVFDRATGEIVNPANEIMEIQKNSMMYTMATRQMSSVITQMRTVINVGK